MPLTHHWVPNHPKTTPFSSHVHLHIIGHHATPVETLFWCGQKGFLGSFCPNWRWLSMKYCQANNQDECSGVDKDLQAAVASRPWWPHNHGPWSPGWILPGRWECLFTFGRKNKLVNFGFPVHLCSLCWRKPVAGSSQQRANPSACAGLRGEGQRPPPHGHQREGRPLPRPSPWIQEDFGQGELCLQATQPRVWKVSFYHQDINNIIINLIIISGALKSRPPSPKTLCWLCRWPIIQW